MEREWIIQLVDLKGFGGADRSEGILYVEESELSGQILSPSLSGDIVKRVSLSDGRAPGVIDLAFDDAEAVKAGLACGGVAQVAIFERKEFPREYFDLKRKRVPFVLVTSVRPSGNTECSVITLDHSDPNVSLPRDVVDKARGLITAAKKSTTVLNLQECSYYISLVAPKTHMVVLGGGDLANKLIELAALLDWSAEIIEESSVTMNARLFESLTLGPLDALVVLSHDHEASTPFIASILKSKAGTYVGSLGSRHTQAERRRRLLELGIGEKEVSEIYGPIGLDGSARSVGETALVICAEVQVHKSKRPLRHLRDSLGPINA